jgi:hypothetical protein
MLMNRRDIAHGLDKSVEETPEFYAWTEWMVYLEYAIRGEQGRRYVEALSEPGQGGAYFYKPLSRPTASLFLEFARWPDEYGMDRQPLDSDKNAEAVKEWLPGRGVLGIPRPDLDSEVWGSSQDVLREFIGGRGEGVRLNRGAHNDGRGGIEETVERFAVEAWKANMVLRLYDAATRPTGPQTDTIVGLMPDRKEGLGDGHYWPSVRDIHGKTPETARNWALDLVEEVVEDEIRGRCWPIPVRRGDGSHGQGWAFDSLLGAMWVQMMWLMLGQSRRCDWCGRVLDVDPEQDLRTTANVNDGGKIGRRKPPDHKRFCADTGGRCRSNWNYNYGDGKSSKKARKEIRDRERGKP